MPRKRFFRSSELIYHAYNRSNNSEWFYIPIERVWKIFREQLSESIAKYKAEIHTFVLMSNHYHMLISTPLANLDSFMRHFQTEVCRQIQREAGRKNHVFGTRYGRTLLPDPIAVSYAYKYVLRNPVRAGMSARVETYPFSTYTALMNRETVFPLTERIDSMWQWIPRGLERMEWLNLPTPKEEEALIGKALRRSTFKFTTSNEHRKTVEGLRDSYGVENIPGAFRA